jgi:hypothetical protein
LRRVISSIIYRSGHIAAVIASYSYKPKFIDQRYCFPLIFMFSTFPIPYISISFHRTRS